MSCAHAAYQPGCSSCNQHMQQQACAAANQYNRALQQTLDDPRQYIGIDRTPPARAVRVGDSVLVRGRDAVSGVTRLLPVFGDQLIVVTGAGPREWRASADRCRHADGAPIDVAATLAALNSGLSEYGANKLPVDAEAARKRIAELEACCSRNGADLATTIREREEARDLLGDAATARNRLSDQAGALANEKRELLAENATLRREIETLQRRAKR